MTGPFGPALGSGLRFDASHLGGDSMLNRGEHDSLVAGFYAAAAGDAAWEDCVRFASEAFGAEAGILRCFDDQQVSLSLAAWGRPSQFAADYYVSEIYSNDPRAPLFYQTRPGSVYFDHMLYDVEAMDRDPRCQAANDVLGVKYSLGAMMRLPNNINAGFAILTSEKEGHATQEAIEAFRRLAPHLEQACALGQVMETRAATRAALLEALALKADGVILLDQAGTPTFINDIAREILAAGDGLALAPGGFLTNRPPETRKLQQFVHTALAKVDGVGGRVLVSRSSGKRPYVVSVMPAPATERFLSGSAIGCVVHIQDLAAVRLPSREVLHAVFGLTDREVDLAIELVRCAGLDAAATNAGMAHNTARNHLQSIARKTGAQGQAEIVQLLGRLV